MAVDACHNLFIADCRVSGLYFETPVRILRSDTIFAVTEIVIIGMRITAGNANVKLKYMPINRETFDNTRVCTSDRESMASLEMETNGPTELSVSLTVLPRALIYCVALFMPGSVNLNISLLAREALGACQWRPPPSQRGQRRGGAGKEEA